MTRVGTMLFAAVLLAGLGCSDDETGPEPVPDELRYVSGDGQIGAPGAPLDEPFVVEVVTETGEPVAGVELLWQVTDGTGQLSETTPTTGADGRSSVTYTLGDAPGTETVRVIATGLGIGAVEFDATAVVTVRTAGAR